MCAVVCVFRGGCTLLCFREKINLILDALEYTSRKNPYCEDSRYVKMFCFFRETVQVRVINLYNFVSRSTFGLTNIVIFRIIVKATDQAIPDM